HEEVLRVFGLDLPIADWAKEEGIADAEIKGRIGAAADRRLAEKAANFGPDLTRRVEKSLLMQVLDQVWKEHLLTLDHLRQGIGLRAYGQRDPLNEYKTEAFALFEQMLDRLRERVTTILAHVELRMEDPAQPLQPGPPKGAMETRSDPAFARDPRPAFDANDPATWGRVPRNAPCPCGSGRKYKHCHGKAA
ncbi:MAG: preprotein translocase subunit SecA, partial [Alphaproteobacteria bacterium]|nr:preprotein translocase subunit SecA [Alphaproteobacteria bacterium]